MAIPAGCPSPAIWGCALLTLHIKNILEQQKLSKGLQSQSVLVVGLIFFHRNVVKVIPSTQLQVEKDFGDAQKGVWGVLHSFISCTWRPHVLICI
jgi:hypothetical protein